MASTTTELTYGKIEIDLTEVGGSTVETYFGFLSQISVKGPLGLKTYWGPKYDNGSTIRQLFTTLVNNGPGSLRIGGTLATTADGDTICTGINNILDATFCETLYEKLELRIDYNFNDSPDTVATLKDVKISGSNLQSAGLAMQGSITFQFGRADCS